VILFFCWYGVMALMEHEITPRLQESERLRFWQPVAMRAWRISKFHKKYFPASRMRILARILFWSYSISLGFFFYFNF